ncbi:MAG: site-specific integrase, partial [Paracoccaceae bacterium]|nr:site-specific integrase [Paracoccaceae bacterium]
MTGISPAARDALEDWLAAQAALRGLSQNTITAYRTDLLEFLAFLTIHEAEQLGIARLIRVGTRDIRSWMAHERGRGVSARSVARALSAIKTFYRWLSEKENFDATAILSARSPKFAKSLPRALSETAA